MSRSYSSPGRPAVSAPEQGLAPACPSAPRQRVLHQSWPARGRTTGQGGTQSTQRWRSAAQRSAAGDAAHGARACGELMSTQRGIGAAPRHERPRTREASCTQRARGACPGAAARPRALRCPQRQQSLRLLSQAAGALLALKNAQPRFTCVRLPHGPRSAGIGNASSILRLRAFRTSPTGQVLSGWPRAAAAARRVPARRRCRGAMAANLAASLTALGAPSSGTTNNGGAGGAPPKLPPKKRHRPEGASSVSNGGPVRVGESLLRATAEGTRWRYRRRFFGHRPRAAAVVLLHGSRRAARTLDAH